MNSEKLTFLLKKLINCWHLRGLQKNTPRLRVVLDEVRFAINSGKHVNQEKINKLFENQDEFCSLSPEEVEEGHQIVRDLCEIIRNDPWVWTEIPGRIVCLNKKKQVQREKIIKKKQEKENTKQKKIFKEKFQEMFLNDFLSADDFFESSPWKKIFSDQDYHEIKVHFVQEWAKNNLKNLLNNRQLDDQQAAAIGAVNGNILVVARAGSGKTTTLTSRAVFLQKHCGISPHQLLLLAFNKSAAKEMENRLASVLGEDIPHVMTFHALAYALVHPEEEILYDDEKKGWRQLSDLVQEIIRDQMREQRFLNMIKEVMLSHFQDDWEQIVKGGFHLPVPELIAHRSSLPRETLAGEFVESFGEKIIANTLFKNDIEYKYGRKIYRNREISEKKYFSIGQGKAKAVIYYFDLTGYDGFGEPLEQENANRQKDLYYLKENGWSVFDFTSSDIIPDGCEEFSRKVLERMKEKGIKVKALNDEEIWQKISVRALDSFTKAMTSFVQRCRKLNFSPEDLELKISEHETISGAERVFLEIGKITYSNYLEELGNRNKQDFDGLMWEAIELLKKGESCFSRKGGRETGDLKNLRFVLVDEFQDFSEPFYALLNEMRNFNKSASFFCVGDDWQAINGFAGSDLKFYENFEEFFSCPKKLDISTNYRSAEKIVQIGNTLMQEKKPHARASTSEPGRVRVAYLSDFNPTLIESNLHKGKKFIPSVLRLADSFLKEQKEVVLLSRENNVRDFFCSEENSKKNQSPLNLFLNHLRSFLDEEQKEKVKISTVHNFKGLEKEAVIIVDAVPGRYPLIHPNWVFQRIFDSIEKIHEEERRLFYVALTRAKNQIVLLCDSERNKTVFLKNISMNQWLETLYWDELPPVLPRERAKLVEIRVFNAFPVKQYLEELHYKFNNGRKSWERTVPEADFNFEQLCNSPWAVKGVSIEALSSTNERIAFKKIKE